MAHDSAGLGITIAGMHRSGTSALAGTLSLLGVQAPKTLFSDHWNPKGHFESIPVIDISNEALQSLGLEVEDWGALPPNGLSSQDIAKLSGQFASAIRSEFSRNLIVVKDPRFCRFPELIAAGLNQAGWRPAFVLIYRNPFEVAMSLERRNGLPLDYNLLIWLRSLLDAERGTRGFPRAFLSYESLITNWREAIDKLQRKLGLIFPRRSTRAEAEVDRFLEADLRHFKLSSRPSGTAFEDWLVRTWDAYIALDDDAGSKTAQDALDQVNAAFTTSSNKLHGLVCLLTADKSPKPAEPSKEEMKQAVTTALADSQQQNQQFITQFSTLVAEQAEALNTARLTSGQMAEHVSQTVGKLFMDTQQHNQQLLAQVSALVAEQTESLGAVRLTDAQMAEQVSQTVGKLFMDTQQHNQQLLAQVTAMAAEQASVVREAAQTLNQIPAQISAEHTLRARMQEALFDEKLARLQERLSARENALAASIERAARAETAAEQAHKREIDQIANIRSEADARINQIEADAELMVALAREHAEQSKADAELRVALAREHAQHARADAESRTALAYNQAEQAKADAESWVALLLGQAEQAKADAESRVALACDHAQQAKADAESRVALAHSQAEEAKADAASMVAVIRGNSQQAIESLRNQIKKQSQQAEAKKTQQWTLISLFDAQMSEITHANEQALRFSRDITSGPLLLRMILRQWPKRQKILQAVVGKYPLSPEHQNILMHWVGRRRILFGLLRRSHAARSALVQVQVMNLCTTAQKTSWQRLKEDLHESLNEDTRP